MAERVYLTVAEVQTIHQAQIEEYGGAHGIRDRGLLESAVFRPQVGYYNNIAEEAEALMESLANNHPFIDGNKRVAFASAHTFLLVNGYDLEVDPPRAYKFMMETMAKSEFRFGLILEWISSHLRSLTS
ncbi:MAG: type II toxin-antitoxin system death-on-curing family toxin [Candidatus Sulfotelmatobacter sp.]